MIKIYFVTCALTCVTDGSEEDEITCFKVCKPCSEGRVMLKSQLEYTNSTEPNPFVPDEEDKLVACPQKSNYRWGYRGRWRHIDIISL